MEATLSNYKRKAADAGLDEDPPVPGPPPPPPRPFRISTLGDDSDSESDTESTGRGDAPGETGRGTTRLPVDDGLHWLESKQRTPRGAAVHVERQRLTLGDRDDIDLSAPYLRDVLDDAAKSRSHLAPIVSKADPAPVRKVAKAVPKASDWES